VPFARGDVVVGCTLLNDPKDDHRGRGRILHYDAQLKLKNTLWLDDTTHIVQGTRFDPDGSLWAFDTFAYKIVRFARDGRRLPNFAGAPARGFANVCFAPDGRFFLGENYVGEKSRVPLRTTLPFMPGTRRFGDGHLFEFSPQGKLLREHATRVHGGMGGFQALTSAALVPSDATRIVYTSESGPKIFQYDLAARRQMPDLVSFDEKSGKFYFDVAFDREGRLLVVTGRGVDAFDLQGRLLRSYPLEGFGWASMSPLATGDHVYVTNFFTGGIARLDLKGGTVTATAETGGRRSLSGAAEFPG
jgi:sugar lactone lactonase YvrE